VCTLSVGVFFFAALPSTLLSSHVAVVFVLVFAVCRSRRENDEVPWYRIDEIKSTDKLVMVVNRFASMKAVVPELFDGLEERGVWASQNLESLNGAYLATLAWSYARVGLGSDDLFSAIQSAASACADMSEADQQNIDWAVATRA